MLQVDSEHSRSKKLEEDLKSASNSCAEDHSLVAKHRQVNFKHSLFSVFGREIASWFILVAYRKVCIGNRLC